MLCLIEWSHTLLPVDNGGYWVSNTPPLSSGRYPGGGVNNNDSQGPPSPLIIVVVVVNFGVVILVVNVVVLVVVVIFADSKAVAGDVRIHGEGEALYDSALVNGDDLRVGGKILRHPAPVPTTTTTARRQVPPAPTETTSTRTSSFASLLPPPRDVADMLVGTS